MRRIDLGHVEVKGMIVPFHMDPEHNEGLKFLKRNSGHRWTPNGLSFRRTDPENYEKVIAKIRDLPENKGTYHGDEDLTVTATTDCYRGGEGVAKITYFQPAGLDHHHRKIMIEDNTGEWEYTVHNAAMRVLEQTGEDVTDEMLGW